MGNIKQISIEKRTYYFFNDMININDFDKNLLKIDKKSYKNIDIYYTEFITMKNIDGQESIHKVNRLYFIIGEVDGDIEQSNENIKEVLTKCTKRWDGIKCLIEKINDKPGEYGKDFKEIKFNSDDNLPLN